MKKLDQKQLAGIEYHGISDVTQPCLNAIIRIIHSGDRIGLAKLLTNSGFHCFLLEVNEYAQVAIKMGFSSGYCGEGPKGLATALQLLERHGTDIEEFEVDRGILTRVNESCLLKSDIEAIMSAVPIRPLRWHDYIYDIHQTTQYDDERLRQKFPATIPFGLVDFRIIDLALLFDENPDASIMSGYRRLEDVIRKRTALVDKHGSNLFSKAFHSSDSILYWKDIESGEQTGRAQLFTGIYMAFRNKRAHRQPTTGIDEAVREFMLLNELFILEAEATLRNE